MASLREKINVEMENISIRHFFIHAYGFLLDEEELRLLADDVFGVYSLFKTEIDAFMANL